MPKGKSGPRRGKMRVFSNPEEIERAMNQLHLDEEEKEKAEGEETKEKSSGENSDDDSSDEEVNEKPKGVSNLIEIENPNRTKKAIPKHELDASVGKKDVKVELSRREREEIEKQKSREHYNKLHAQGKTDQAKADLARLAIIRKQREDATARREAEKRVKEDEAKKGKI